MDNETVLKEQEGCGGSRFRRKDQGLVWDRRGPGCVGRKVELLSPQVGIQVWGLGGRSGGVHSTWATGLHHLTMISKTDVTGDL